MGHVEALVEGSEVLRFVWELVDTAVLDEQEDFQQLLQKQ